MPVKGTSTNMATVGTSPRYDFDLRTGTSGTGLRACTYAVEVKKDPADGIDKVYIETPADGHGWRLVELRPVSEGVCFFQPWGVGTNMLSSS